MTASVSDVLFRLEAGSTDGYSRADAKERMMEHLDEMMQEASSEKEREAIRRCMTQLENA